MATLQHTDELYHILEDEICALKILPGEALSENQLCKRFGVSRTPIRSVLQRLEQNRFVQIIPCKGTIVTAIDTGVVDQLIFQRVAVEGMVFRDFVQSCSPMEILAVEHLYNMLLEAAAGRSDPENFDFNHFLSCDLAMHEYWFHKTSKEYLWEQMTRPQADYSRFIRLDIVGARNVSSVVSEHAEMLRILREKDLDAIEPLMRTHLYGGVSRMGSKIYSDEYRGYFKLPENKNKEGRCTVSCAAAFFWLRQQESNLRWGSQSPLPYRLAMAHHAKQYSIFSAVPQEVRRIFAAFSVRCLPHLRRFGSVFGLCGRAPAFSIFFHVFTKGKFCGTRFSKNTVRRGHKIHIAKVKFIFFLIFLIIFSKDCIFCCGSGTLDVIKIS